jgi:hypothetical protein
LPFGSCSPWRRYTRAECDRILRDAAIEEGVPRWKAYIAFAAVRAFGRFCFK